MPLIDKFIASESEYFTVKDGVRHALLVHLRQRLRRLEDVTLHLNLLDRRGRGVRGAYLTVTGTSAESCDSGQAGRGNRVNGLIAFQRPQSLDAHAGKNSVNGVGRLYNQLAQVLAQRLCQTVPDVAGATVHIASRIGEPINRPHLVAVHVQTHTSGAADLTEPIRGLLETELDRLRRVSTPAESVALKVPLALGRPTPAGQVAESSRRLANTVDSPIL